MHKKYSTAGPGNTRVRQFFYLFLSEDFPAVLVNLLGYHIIYPLIGTCGEADGCVGDEIVFSVFIAGSFDLSCNDISGPAFIIHFGTVNPAHERNFAAVLFNQFRYPVGGHDALPDVHAHIDHIGHKGSCIGI